MPDLVDLYQRGETMLDAYVTHNMKFEGEGGGGGGGPVVLCG